MNNLQATIKQYLNFCKTQKRLDTKTLKAYSIDLKQFAEHIVDFTNTTSDDLEKYISCLHQKYQSKTVKRKIASTKAFYRYLEYKDLICLNPFNKIQTRFREPVTLPKIIPLNTLEILLTTMYRIHSNTHTSYARRSSLRDIAVVELLFATGMRISELCSLTPETIDLYNQYILIYGKGSKERKIQLCNADVLTILRKYGQEYQNEINNCGYFFINRNGKRLSEQSIRDMIHKYCRVANIPQHITPHMFRHSFATFLLEEDVDIRYIQEMLGHSSIHITEIYTHVAMTKQRNILTTKHPRKKLCVVR